MKKKTKLRRRHITKKIRHNKTYKATAGSPSRVSRLIDLTTDDSDIHDSNLKTENKRKQPITVDLTGSEDNSKSKSHVVHSRGSNKADVVSVIRRVFDNDLFDIVERNMSDSDVEIELMDLRQHKKRKNKCFILKINRRKKKIEIDSLKTATNGDQISCTLSGTSILHDLIIVAKELNYKIFVGTDLSWLTLSNPAKTKVDLAHYKILLDGQSFYNKAGFRSVDHDKNVAHNQQIRELNVRDIIKSDNEVEEIEEVFDTEITDTTTFADLGKMIKKITQDKDYSDEVARTIRKIVMVVGKLFEYENTDLVYKD
jgi:hypothetical protein